MTDKRMTYILSSKADERLEELVELVKSPSKQQFLDNAVFAYTWIIAQAVARNPIGTFDFMTKEFKGVTFLELAFLQDKQKP